MRKLFDRRKHKKKEKALISKTKAGNYSTSQASSPSVSFTNSRVFTQMQGPQELEYSEPDISIEALPPIQAFAEPMPPDMELQYGWESSILNLEVISKVAEIIANSRNLMIFTGAGVSTESIKLTHGLRPLTRSTAEDLLQRRYYRILKSEEKDTFLKTYLFGSILKILEARSGAGHRAIADLIQILTTKGSTVNLVTQNVDYLHELAAKETGQDPKSVQHIHGWIKTATCPKCGKIHDYKERLTRLKETGNIDFLLCSSQNGLGCNGVLSPDIVEYGELVPEYDQYYLQAQSADTIIVAGTSLRVTPANHLVEIVHRNGGKVIVFDLYGTQMDPITDVHVRAQLEYAFPFLLWKLRETIPLESLGIKERVVTYKLWGNFFENWDSIELENPHLAILEKAELFKSRFDMGLEDPVRKIHNP